MKIFRSFILTSNWRKLVFSQQNFFRVNFFFQNTFNKIFDAIFFVMLTLKQPASHQRQQQRQHPAQALLHPLTASFQIW